MCITGSGVVGVERWNWDGDRIIHRAIVSSARPVIGEEGRGRRARTYPIDVREFLVTERNEVMRECLAVRVKKFIAEVGGDVARFESRTPGSFDHRADMLAAFVGKKVAYESTDGSDPWRFPDETLAIGKGDCEDRALLLASLLRASGISSYNVRVAFGRVHVFTPGRRGKDIDHVWVMYKNEAGRWTILEPLHAKKVESKGLGRLVQPSATHIEYRPRWVFNDVHLWHIDQPHERDDHADEVDLGRHWSKLHPTFAGAVHRSILNEALPPAICPPWMLQALNRRFSRPFFGLLPVIDDVDLDMRHYDPRDHFDNGYIDEGWARVTERLGAFAADNILGLDAFFRAAHAIADFYAHSSYVHFAKIESNGTPVICDPDDIAASLARTPEYGFNSDFDLENTNNFTMNGALFQGSHSDAARLWRGKIISGRYAQVKDTWPGFENFLVEGPTGIPADLAKAPDFARRGSLPHHNEIAVDDEVPGDAHKLYGDVIYKTQFRRRRAAAVRHIREAFVKNRRP